MCSIKLDNCEVLLSDLAANFSILNVSENYLAYYVGTTVNIYDNYGQSVYVLPSIGTVPLFFEIHEGLNNELIGTYALGFNLHRYNFYTTIMETKLVQTG